MQAPTLPSEPPAKEPAERPCSNCGAANALTAAFCWRCYGPFGAQTVPSAVPTAIRGRPGTVPGPQAWTPSPAPSHTSSRGGGLGAMAGIVVLTLAVVAGVVFVLNGRDAVSTPEAFGGMPRIEDAQTRLVVDTFHAQLEATGVEGDIVLYGNGTPTAALVWVRDGSVPSTDAAFDEFAGGFNAGIGSSGSLGARSTEAVAGVTYVCAPVTGVTRGTICMWQVQEIFWLLFDFSGGTLEAGEELAVVAHDAVETA